MDVSASRWHVGNDVGIVDDSVNFYIDMFPKIVIADSGRPEGIDSLDIAVAAGAKRCQCCSQTVTGLPYFTPLAIGLFNIYSYFSFNFLQSKKTSSSRAVCSLETTKTTRKPSVQYGESVKL